MKFIDAILCGLAERPISGGALAVAFVLTIVLMVCLDYELVAAHPVAALLFTAMVMTVYALVTLSARRVAIILLKLRGVYL